MFLALREIRRAPARFGLLAGAVGLLVVLLLFFQSVAATLTGALTGAIANQTAEVVVYDDRARQNPAVSILPADTVEDVTAVDGVKEAAAVAQAFVTVRGPDGAEQEGVLVAIEPGGPGTPARIGDGQLPGSGTAMASGSGFDDAFDVDAQLTVLPSEVTLRVVGQAEQAAANAAATLYVTADTFGEVVTARSPGEAARPPSDGPPVSWVGVEPAEGVAAEELAATITAEVDGVEALTRTEAVAALPGVSTISQSFGILYVLLFAVVAIVTGVFFLILTVQKREALVLLRAVGARRRDVVTPVLLQVVAVVGVGAVLGASATAGLLAATQDTFGGGLDPATAVTSSAAILGLGLLAATAAVRRVLEIEPAEVTMPGRLE